MTSTHKVYLKKKEETRIKKGHLWAFSNEIEKTENIEGTVSGHAELYAADGEFLGTGFYNKNSLISFRILSRQKHDNAGELILNKIAEANKLREYILPGRKVYRMVFAESDFLPGLIIDRYDSSYILQINSAGMEMYKPLIAEYLSDKFGAERIVVKNDGYFRTLEGLPVEEEILKGDAGSALVESGGLQYNVDFGTGQKTGLFLDQTENRIRTGLLASGKSVLDCFCNTGGFGLHAMQNGASSVTFVDYSVEMLRQVKANVQLNNFKVPYELLEGDAFKILKTLHDDPEKKFDLVIVDPPAFVKSRKKIKEAIKGYLTINMNAMKLVNDGGIFATASCSHHLSEADFMNMLALAAEKTGCRLQLLHFAGASSDHPRLVSMPETAYLKFALFRLTR